jgi:hypothetical protein
MSVIFFYIVNAFGEIGFLKDNTFKGSIRRNKRNVENYIITKNVNHCLNVKISKKAYIFGMERAGECLKLATELIVAMCECGSFTSMVGFSATQAKNVYVIS